MDNLQGKELTRALLSSEDFAIAALKVCGVSTTLGGKFLNPYNCREVEPSAYLRATTDGRFVIRYWRLENQERKGHWFSLPQLYRDHVSGCLAEIRRGEDNPRRRSIGKKSESAVWLIRLATETGFVTLPEVSFVALDSAPESARRVYQGSVLLQKCRTRYDPANTTFPAAARFIADWTGLSESEVGIGKRWLVTRRHWIVYEKGQPYAKGKTATPTLYRLASAPEVSTRERANRREYRRQDLDIEIDNRRVPTNKTEKDRLYFNIPDSLEEAQAAGLINRGGVE